MKTLIISNTPSGVILPEGLTIFELLSLPDDLLRLARKLVGKTLEASRTKANPTIKLKDMAMAINISPQLLSGIENGRHGASPKIYKQLTQEFNKLGVNVFEILEETSKTFFK